METFPGKGNGFSQGHCQPAKPLFKPEALSLGSPGPIHPSTLTRCGFGGTRSGSNSFGGPSMVSRGMRLFRGLYHFVHPRQHKEVWPGHRKDLLREAVERRKMTSC